MTMMNNADAIRCTLSLREIDKAIEFYIPAEAVEEFNRDYEGPQGTKILFIRPNRFIIMHHDSKTNPFYKRESHFTVRSKGREFLSLWQPFRKYPGTVKALNGRLEVTLDKVPTPATVEQRNKYLRPSRQSSPLIRDNIQPVPRIRKGDALVNSTEFKAMLSVLREIKRLELETPYQLIKVQHNDGTHTFEWNAHSIKLEDV